MIVKKIVIKTADKTTIEFTAPLSVLLKAKKILRRPDAAIEVGPYGQEGVRRKVTAVEYQYYYDMEWK